jgi:hypothetical protein
MKKSILTLATITAFFSTFSIAEYKINVSSVILNQKSNLVDLTPPPPQPNCYFNWTSTITMINRVTDTHWQVYEETPASGGTPAEFYAPFIYNGHQYSLGEVAQPEISSRQYYLCKIAI